MTNRNAVLQCDMIKGTNYFASEDAARIYYNEQGYDAKEVARKIIDKEIIIGLPKLEPGQKLISREGRFFIQG